MLNEIFVIVGITGQYDDKREWFVCAYTDEEQAQLHADKANKYAQEIYKREKSDNPYDPYMQIDLGGTDYQVAKVDLYLHVDQYQELNNL